MNKCTDIRRLAPSGGSFGHARSELVERVLDVDNRLVAAYVGLDTGHVARPGSQALEIFRQRINTGPSRIATAVGPIDDNLPGLAIVPGFIKQQISLTEVLIDQFLGAARIVGAKYLQCIADIGPGQ